MYFLNMEDFDREVYEKELKSFLPDEFIDFHVHVFKNNFERFGAQSKAAATKVKSWVGLIGKDTYLDEMTIEQLNDTLTTLFPDKKVTPLLNPQHLHTAKPNLLLIKPALLQMLYEVRVIPLESCQ